MSFGRFSVSLSVKDIRASRDFYQKLGFEILDDHESKNWMILDNGTAIIGLFQGAFPKNTLTFNPTDVRAVQRRIRANGLSLLNEADEKTTGPAFAMLMDPDGNPILIDEHDPNYKPTPADVTKRP